LALKYALIGHNLSLELLYQNSPQLQGKPLTLVKKILLEKEPYKATDLVGVKSITGQEITGYGFSIDLLPEQFYELDKKIIIQKIQKAYQMAANFGVQIVALGAFTAPACNHGLALKLINNVAVTTGNSYTAAETIEAIKIASKEIGINIKESTITIVGATGSIGNVCSQIIAEMSNKIILVARNIRKLKDLEAKINNRFKNKAIIEKDIVTAIKRSNIVITATSASYAIMDAKDFNPGTLVVDVAIPRDVSLESGRLRNDILIIDGGMMRPPGNLKKSDFNIGLPTGIAPACLCESMILALENRIENFTYGLMLEPSKVRQLYDLGKKHGFKLSGFLSFGKPISNALIGRIKTTLQKLTI
jgi:fatty aldehyde-generating acyl-ACP reductase